jgi:antitoxin (DNA-binding transcriptional repressor) of toxin-antitoxin stability system
MATASIRDLRNHFPKIRKLLDADGEVLLTEKGKTRYRLVLHTPAQVKEPPPVDYWARLIACQPRAMSAAQARALQEDLRGER